MSVHAIIQDYRGAAKDVAANFHGNIIVYFSWTDHLMFCAPLAFPLPPDMPFGTLLTEVLPPHFGAHPQWAEIDWSTTQWELNRKPFTPDLSKSLADNGIDHKSVLRFTTPGLTGYKGSHS